MIHANPFKANPFRPVLPEGVQLVSARPPVETHEPRRRQRAWLAAPDDLPTALSSAIAANLRPPVSRPVAVLPSAGQPESPAAEAPAPAASAPPVRWGR